MDNANVTVTRPGILRVPYVDYVSMYFTYASEIKRQVNEFNPDVIVAQSILTNFLSIRLARTRRIPVVFHALEAQYTMVPERMLKHCARFLESYNFRNADKTVVINEKLKEYAIRMGARPDDTYVVRAGVDLGRYNSTTGGSEIRRKYGMDEDDIILFFMGWLYHFSGLKEVAKELSGIEDPRVKLFIVGEGDAYPDLERIVVRYGLQKRVILAGKQPYKDIPSLIASADICLLPAYNNETMRDIVPIKMYEYLAMGKPVISTNLPGVREEFGEDHGVLYVGGPTEVTNKAMNLVRDGKVEAEGIKGRRFVEGKSWDKVVKEFEDILNLAIIANQES